MKPIEIASQVEHRLIEVLLFAEAESERRQRPYAYVAAERLWDVIVKLPDAAREATLRRLGADDCLLAYVDEPDDGSLPTEQQHAALGAVTARLEHALSGAGNDEDPQDRAERARRYLGWRFI